jgi:Protein of unknown function (DUF2778)
VTIYNQSGFLTVGGVEFTAYSGHGEGLNNPALEAVHNIGPIPRGPWEVVEWLDNYENKGSCVARLAPVGHDAHGRSGFLCHGDNPEQNHTASDGCIVAAHDARQAWRNSGDMNLTVE